MLRASGTSFDYIAENFRAIEKMINNLRVVNTARGLIGATVRKKADSLMPKLGNLSAVFELLGMGGENHRGQCEPNPILAAAQA
jgi:hypothetical protein